MTDLLHSQQAGGQVGASQMTSFNDLYSVKDLLGVGAYGVVLKVKNRQTQEKSALKIINKDNLSKKALSILRNESCIMKSMQHRSVRARRITTPNTRASPWPRLFAALACYCATVSIHIPTWTSCLRTRACPLSGAMSVCARCCLVSAVGGLRGDSTSSARSVIFRTNPHASGR